MRMTNIDTESRATISPYSADRYFPNVVLRTQDDRPVRFYDDLLKDSIVMVNFFYTTCAGTCSMTMHNLARICDIIGDHLGREVRMLSISIDPARDTPAVLKAFAEDHQVRPGWYFLTGSRDDVNLIRDRLGARDRYNREGPHTAVLVYGNVATGQWATAPALGDATLVARSVLRLVELARHNAGASSNM